MKRTKPERVGIVYYWKSAKNMYAVQIVHDTRSATMDSSQTEEGVKNMAKELGYKLVKTNG